MKVSDSIQRFSRKRNTNRRDFESEIKRIKVEDGSLSEPSISFENDTDTGFFRSASGQIAYSSNGALHTTWGPTLTQTDLPVVVGSGSAAAPGFAFSTDQTTGMYYTNNQLNFSIGGSEEMVLNAANLDLTGVILKADTMRGSTTASVGFLEDVDIAGTLTTDTIDDSGAGQITCNTPIDMGDNKILMNAGTSTTRGLRFAGTNDGIYYASSATTITGDLRLNDEVVSDIIPNADATYDLGTASLQWDNIYSANAVTVSDERKKQDIQDLDMGMDFIRQLRPVSFKWKDGFSKDKNVKLGFIAQEIERIGGGGIVKKQKKKIGKDDKGEPIFDEKEEEYGLCAMELLAPIVNAVKELEARITALEE
jgi:hypothetical protein